ncbi:FHA domain-containing protein [Bifidobacterium sp. CP2]|uniref:variant leucine-rich repeat-containing protein n=1 Tax=Bifidobacterium sp. CP2 TaxID=2809025 RepID=UPI001BDD500F|nr:FHA domain-containing protein [Bifidobacterium sp. CP2]
MSEQQASQWRVKVGGGDQVSVRPGESLEIGRKPLRPLPDDGVARLEIEDGTKSMSKRHARFSVSADGSAQIRDLSSTNGSYVVNEKGELMRLPAERDYTLPSSPMRIQFGDVPLDFVRIEADERPVKPVPNLFSYSDNTTRQEPDAADMSVDDILDLRAGEPTAVFSAQHARHAAPVVPGTLNAPVTLGNPLLADLHRHAEPAAQPARSAQDAQGVQNVQNAQNVPATQDAQPESQAQPEEQQQNADVTDNTAALEQKPAGEVTVAEPDADQVAAGEAAVETPFPEEASRIEEPPADSMPLRVVETPKPSLPRNLFTDAMAADAASESGPEHDRTAAPAVDAVIAAHQDAESAAPVASNPTQGAVPERVVAQPQTVTFVPMDARQAPGVVTGGPSAAPADDLDDATGVYKPAFEAGSVFEKVSNGDFDKPAEPEVEVDGYTAKDARTTSDMTLQFEMARHSELLPFLAMNPALYDDLYAWLAAQGDRDIDEALEHNAGYQDYRQAVGK